MSTFRVRVPGKIILSGEHAVVYGFPALVMAVDRQLTVAVEYDPKTIDPEYFHKLLADFPKQSVLEVINHLNAAKGGFKLTIESNIPIGCGMGSSAALAAAVAAVVLHLAGRSADQESINQKAYLLEKQIHQNPSGVDNTIVVYGGLLRYQKVSENEKKMEPVALQNPLPQLWAINSGVPEESTGEMVGLVRERLAADEAVTNRSLADMGRVAEDWYGYLTGANNRFTVAEAIRHNEQLLESIGVVSDSAKKIIRLVEAIGGSAKISGAGGKNGASGIIIAYHERPDELQKWLNKQSLDWFPVKLSRGGIQIQLVS